MTTIVETESECYEWTCDTCGVGGYYVDPHIEVDGEMNWYCSRECFPSSRDFYAENVWCSIPGLKPEPEPEPKQVLKKRSKTAEEYDWMCSTCGVGKNHVDPHIVVEGENDWYCSRECFPASRDFYAENVMVVIPHVIRGFQQLVTKPLKQVLKKRSKTAGGRKDKKQKN